MNRYHLLVGQHSYYFQTKGSHVSVFNHKEDDKAFLEFDRAPSTLKGVREESFWQILMAGHYFQGQIEKLQQHSETEEFDGKIRSSGAGRVAKLHVGVGQSVQKEEVLCTIEAMKMEYPIATPSEGIVTAVLVNVGDQVERGSHLIEVENFEKVPSKK